MDEGGTMMMMITITVILEGWKSRHALSLVLIHNATDSLSINFNMIKDTIVFPQNIIQTLIRFFHEYIVLFFFMPKMSFPSENVLEI